MGESARAGSAFRLKRLVREYGRNSDEAFGILTIGGTVPHNDVHRAFVNGNGHRLSIIKCLFIRKPDFADVVSALRFYIIKTVEVIPVVVVNPTSHRTMYVIVLRPGIHEKLILIA